MLVWDLAAAGLTAAAVTILLGVALRWRWDDRRHWISSGTLIFSLIFAGAWALGSWLSPHDGGPLNGLYWATFVISAIMVGLAVTAVLPQRILHQSIDHNESVRAAGGNGQIGGVLYWMVMTLLIAVIVRHYVA